MFESTFDYRGDVELPAFSWTRVMMMPFVIGDADSLPGFLSHWTSVVMDICRFSPEHEGKTGYLTIDEKNLDAGRTHRRAGLHVDGVYRGGGGAWGGGGWGSVATGMLTVSSHVGCIAWKQKFKGWPGSEGDCEHLRAECRDGNRRLFLPREVFWLGGLCVHESLAQPFPVARQFVRVSLPSTAPWFDGYTVNPLGIKPTGEILPWRHEFMK